MNRSNRARPVAAQITPLLLTPEEAATYLGLGRTTLFSLIATGEIESVKIGRSRRIPHQSLVSYVDRLRRK